MGQCLTEIISYTEIFERLKRVVPIDYFQIFMDKSSLIPGHSQLRLEDANVQRVAAKINNEKIDFVFVSVKTFFNQSVLSLRS